jgi:hypothetical protein
LYITTLKDKEANKKYANVSIEALELFKELCEECQLKKRKLASKGLVVKPIVSKEFNSRCQMDYNCFHASMLRSYLLYLRFPAQHFPGFVGVSASHEQP